MSYKFEIEGGSTVKFLVGGKYCDRDIEVTAKGGGGSTDIEDGLITRTLTEYSNERVTSVGVCAFQSFSTLQSVNLPNVTRIGAKAFNSCSILKRVVLPKLTEIQPGDNFTYCYALEYVDLAFAYRIPSWCLANCPKLETIILRKSDSICTLQATNGLSGTLVANGTGYVYVPAALVDEYKAATNWSTYANQIRAIEDYPEICGEVSA